MSQKSFHGRDYATFLVYFDEGHGLVQHLLSWRLSIERLTRSLMVVVMFKLFNPFACAHPTAHPRVMETVNSYFESVKPRLDTVSVGIINPTVQS